MKISEIKKINVQDGDIIIFPKTTHKDIIFLSDILHKTFPSIKFLVLTVDKLELVEGIKILHLEK